MTNYRNIERRYDETQEDRLERKFQRLQERKSRRDVRRMEKRTIRSLERATPDEIKQDAFDQVLQDPNLKDLPIDQQIEAAEKRAAEMQATRDRSLAASRSAVTDAKKAGAALKARDVLPSAEQREAAAVGLTPPPPKEDVEGPGILAQLDRAPNTLAGFTAGTIGGLRELVKDEPRPDETPLSPMAYMNNPGQLLKDLFGKAVDVRPAQAVGRAISSPENAASVLKSAVERAKFGWNNPGQPTLDKELKDIEKGIVQAAEDRAFREMQSGLLPPEKFNERADALAKNMTEASFGTLALEHPDLANFLHKAVIDPQNYVPVGKILGATGNLARNTGITRGIEKGARALKETLGFTWMPHLDPLRMAKTEEARKGAELVELASEEGSAAAKYLQTFGSEELTALKQVTDPAEKEKLFRALTGKEAVDIAQESENFQAAYKAGKKLAVKSRRIKELARVGGGRESVPSRIVKAGDTLEDDLVDMSQRGNFMDPTSVSAKAVDEGAELLPDAAKQWEAELGQLRSKLPKAYELGKTVDYLSGGAVNLVHKAGKAVNTADKVQLTKFAKELGEKHGVEYVALDKDPILDAAMRKFGGKVGEEGVSTLVPAPMRDHLRTLTPFLGETGTSAAKAAEELSTFNAYFMGPAMKALRMGVAFTPGYFTRNLFGGMTFQYLAHGLKAANPKLQQAGAQAAFVAAGLGKRQGLRTTMKLADGETVSLAKIYDIGRKTGMLDQTDELMQYGRKTKGPLDAISKTLEKGTAPLHNLNKMSDNYNRMAVFAGFLKNTRPEGIADAVNKTSKYMGNFKRMGVREKQLLGNGLYFYSWLRFALPHTLKSIVMHPERMAAFQKIRQGLEQSNGGQAPYGKEVIPEHLRGRGFTAPEFAQPPDLQKYLKDGKFPKLGSHEFAMMVMENPMTMATGYLQLFDPEGTSTYTNLASQLGPIYEAIAQMGTGRDWRTGQELPSLGDIWNAEGSALQKYQKIGNSALGTLGRSTQAMAWEPWQNIYRLYTDPNAKADLQARAMAARDFQGSSNLIARLLGEEGMELGGIPGFSTYIVNPRRELQSRQKRGAQILKQEASQLSKPVFGDKWFGPEE